MECRKDLWQGERSVDLRRALRLPVLCRRRDAVPPHTRAAVHSFAAVRPLRLDLCDVCSVSTYSAPYDTMLGRYMVNGRKVWWTPRAIFDSPSPNFDDSRSRIALRRAARLSGDSLPIRLGTDLV